MLSILVDNYTVYQAFNIKDAYSIAQKHLPDLVVTDWEMPEGSGIELIETLKNNPSTKEIPVVMVTGVMTDTEHLKIAFEAGATFRSADRSFAGKVNVYNTTWNDRTITRFIQEENGDDGLIQRRKNPATRFCRPVLPRRSRTAGRLRPAALRA